MKGGLFINPNNVENTVIDYLENSDIQQLSRGAYGVTYKTSLRQNIQEFFLNLDVGNNFKQNIRELVVKICVINVLNNETTLPTYNDTQTKFYALNLRARTFIRNNLNISPVNRNEFIEEVNVQTDIYLKTVKYLQPLCPGIAYTNIITDNRNNNTGTSNDEKMLNLLGIPIFTDNKPNKTPITYGIIVMELAKNYNTMHEILSEIDDQIPQTPEILEDRFHIIITGFFMLIQLALETGYTHGDFHGGNIMVNKNYDTYFYNLPIRMLIIDFGRTIKIPQLEMEMFRERCNNKQYIQALQILCHKPVANKYVANRQHNKFYGWVCDIFNYGMFENTNITEIEIEQMNGKINNGIDDLFSKRERQINTNIETMKDLHDQISDYPLIPLSNSAKNNLFSGFIENIRLETEDIVDVPNEVEQIRRQEPLDWSFAPLGSPQSQQVLTPPQQVLTPQAQNTLPEPPQIQRRRPRKTKTGGSRKHKKLTKRRKQRKRTNKRR